MLVAQGWAIAPCRRSHGRRERPSDIMLRSAPSPRNQSLVARSRSNLSHGVATLSRSQRSSLRAASVVVALLALLALALPSPCAARRPLGFKVHLPPIGVEKKGGGNKGGGNKGVGNKGGGNNGGGNNGGGNNGGGNNGGGNNGGGNNGGGGKGGGDNRGNKGGPVKGIGLQPLSCYFATKACDFVFNRSASLAPILPLVAMRPDQPISAAILHKAGSRPVVSASLQTCRALNTLALRLPSCPAFSLVSPSASSNGVRIAGKALSLLQLAQYSGACFTLEFAQMMVKLGSGPRGMTRLVRGDGNAEFPE
ncbi:unnamed protein product, partial [Closterium sp. NIES-65]